MEVREKKFGCISFPSGSPAACKAMVDELSYEVGKVDPKKTIQVRVAVAV